MTDDAAQNDRQPADDEHDGYEPSGNEPSGNEPSGYDADQLRARLHQQAASLRLDRPDETALEQRVTGRKRRRFAAIGTSAVLFAGALSAGVYAVTRDDGGDNRVQVASPDPSDDAANDADESAHESAEATEAGSGTDSQPQGARDRSGSGLVFSPLPLELTSIALPDDVEAWDLMVDGASVYGRSWHSQDGHLVTSTDLETWQTVPTPELGELLGIELQDVDSHPDDDWTEAQWQEWTRRPSANHNDFAVRGDVIASVVSVWYPPEGPFDAPESSTGSEPEWAEHGGFAHCENGEFQEIVEHHLVVSYDAGTTWSSVALPDTNTPDPSDYVQQHTQWMVATDGSHVVLSEMQGSHVAVECVLLDRGVVESDDHIVGMSYGGPTIEAELEDGTSVEVEAEDLGMTGEEWDRMLAHDEDPPVTLHRVEGNAIREVHTTTGWGELLGTTAGIVFTSHGPDGPRYLATTDGGGVWSDITAPGMYANLTVSGNDLIAQSDGSISASSDLGATWATVDSPNEAGFWQTAVNNGRILAIGHDYSGQPGYDENFELTVSIDVDDRTLTLVQRMETISITVTDLSGNVLFATEGDPNQSEPPAGVMWDDMGGITVVDEDGATIIEVDNELWFEAIEAAFSEQMDIEEPYDEPDMIIGYHDGTAWAFSTVEELVGQQGWASAVVPWGDGFLVVFEPKHEMHAEPDDIAESGEEDSVSSGSFAAEEYRPTLVLMTPTS